MSIHSQDFKEIHKYSCARCNKPLNWCILLSNIISYREENNSKPNKKLSVKHKQDNNNSKEVIVKLPTKLNLQSCMKYGNRQCY